MKRIPLLGFVVVVAAIHFHTLSAQTDQQKSEARRLASEGVQATDAGDLDKGLDLLQQAAQLDPSEPNYRYEQAYVYYSRRDYKQVITTIEKLLNGPKAEDRWYQLLGNAYDNLGNRDKALKIYHDGLEHFPNSGELHLELGVMALMDKDIDKAMGYWEEGIQRDPLHASNYYWAAKVLNNSSYRIYGLIYSEIFLLLEPSTRRSAELSEMMFNTYTASIQVNGDSLEIHLSPSTLEVKSAKPKLPMRMSYEMVTGLSAATTAIGKKEGKIDTAWTIARLHQMRSMVTKMWGEMKMAKEYPNVLFDWQAEVEKAGHREAYDYWLLRGGNPNEFTAWADANRPKLEAFAHWISDHSIPIDRKHYFSRLDEEH